MSTAAAPRMTKADPATIVLALNSGSSSLKFGLYRVGHSRTETLLSGEAEAIGDEAGRFHAQDAGANPLASEAISVTSHREVVARVVRLVADARAPPPTAIGHRIVHGGPKLRRHCLIDDAVIRDLQAATAFAPLHTPAALSVIQVSREHFPDLPQAACFDTTFHAHLPDVARVLPIPKQFRSQGIERYGFHGLSCESIVRQLGSDPPSRLVIAHLGNGASLTAVKDGRSIDTSMGLTPTGGVIMGTRSGDLDPGVLIYLMREHGLGAAGIEQLVDQCSGLLGISHFSGDMRRLHEAAASNSDARLAVAMFCYCVRKQLAAMIGALDGVDLVVFTGGIGEHDAAVRAEICAGLSWIGVSLDAGRNICASSPINDFASRCSVQVLTSQEDEQIAIHTRALTIAR